MKKRVTKGRRGKGEGVTTGVDEEFFLGGDSEIAGFMHYKPPRWTSEYRRMKVSHLLRRVQSDLKELLARAYPDYSKEWQQQFAPNYWRDFPITYESRLRKVIDGEIADSDNDLKDAFIGLARPDL